MAKRKRSKPKRKPGRHITRETIEIVNPRYQPTKVELNQDMRIKASPEEVAKAVMQRVEVRHVRKPKPSE